MKTKIVLFLSLAILFASCEQSNGVKEPKSLQLSPLEKQLTQDCNDFSFSLLAQVAQNDESENIILSPLSASMLLGMLINGADGATLAQMQAVTGFGDKATIDEINAYYRQLIDVLPALDTHTRVGIANGIWVREDFPVRDTFVLACKENFDAAAKNVPSFLDQKVLDEINQFAAHHTHNHIKKVIDANMVDENTAMALLNALYFKAIWKDKFKKEKTYAQTFTTLKGTAIQTNMMHQTEEWRYGEDKEYQLLELPYKGQRYCADVILPAKGIDIRTWAKGLNAERWKKMLSYMNECEVTTAIPKFLLNYNRKLNDDLKALGMTEAFGYDANFSRLSERPSYLDLIQQYTYMQVDEEGTEAAAVTIGLIADKASPMHVEFIADRPFLFVIREKSYGTILFTAIIGHPEWQK